ncbi:hypothetical protein HDK64DRAFT_80134 [Phyllosticta capitalensis]|uniref:Secreted protein n=1 Tax=Phyllosticta capitalensis TaxID=121624 RepID=A0ABR1YTV2_9PEZI
MPTLALLLVFLLCRRACSRCRCSACRHLRDWLRTCPCALGLAVVVPLLSRCRLGHVDWWYFTLLCCQSNSPKSFHPQSSNPPPLFDNIFCQSNLLKPVHPQSSNLPPLFDNILCHQGKFLALLILFPSPPIRMLAFFAGLSSLGMESFVCWLIVSFCAFPAWSCEEFYNRLRVVAADTRFFCLGFAHG